MNDEDLDLRLSDTAATWLRVHCQWRRNIRWVSAALVWCLAWTVFAASAASILLVVVDAAILAWMIHNQRRCLRMSAEFDAWRKSLERP